MLDAVIIQLLLDRQVRSIVAPYLSTWMLEDELCKKLLKTLLKPDNVDAPTKPKLLLLDVSSSYELNRKDISRAQELFNSNGKPLTDETRKRAIHKLSTFIKGRKIARSLDKIALDGSTSRNLLSLEESVRFSIAFEDEFVDFSEEQVIRRAYNNDLPPGGKVIESTLNLVNKYTVFHGYKIGDLVMVAGAPGSGKSTLLINESSYAIRQGFRVAHMFLGDLTEFDVASKYMALWCNVTIEEVVTNYEKFWNNEKCQRRFRRLKVACVPPEEFDIHEVVGKFESLYRKWPFNAAIIDYDANIKDLNESMYEEGGKNYGLIKKSGIKRWVNLVACQTKIPYWSYEIAPKESASESSRKQHHIDIMMTLGHNPDVDFIGSVHIPKSRRGRSGITSRIRYYGGKGKIVEIPSEKYDEILRENKKGISSSKGGNVQIKFIDE